MKATIPTPHVPEGTEDERQNDGRSPQEIIEDITTARFPPAPSRGVNYA